MKYKFTDYLKESLRNDLKRVMREDLATMNPDGTIGSMFRAGHRGSIGHNYQGGFNPTTAKPPINTDDVEGGEEVPDGQPVGDFTPVVGPPFGFYTNGDGDYFYDANGDGYINESDWHWGGVILFDPIYVDGQWCIQIEFDSGLGGFLTQEGGILLNADSMEILGIPAGSGQYLLAPNGIIYEWVDTDGDGIGDEYQQWTTGGGAENATTTIDGPGGGSIWDWFWAQDFLTQIAILAGLYWAGSEVWQWIQDGQQDDSQQPIDDNTDDDNTDDNTDDDNNDDDEGGGWGYNYNPGGDTVIV